MEQRKRSRSYPGASLADSVANVRQVQAKLGAGVHSRDHVSAAIGSPTVSGASARKIASMVAFGFLDRSGDGYSITPLARQLLRPLPGEEQNLLQRAFLSVDLYKEVFDAYEGEDGLPEHLPVILERKFGIADDIGSFAAKILRDSAITAGLTDAAGQFIPLGQEGADLERPPLQEEPPRQNQSEYPVAGWRDDALLAIELPKPRAVFQCSKNLSLADKKRLISWIDTVLKPQLEFLVEEAEDDI